jgi:glycerol kinase
VPEVSRCCEQGRLLFGTVDSWLLWKLTGGLHMTDVTNASRTLLMNLETLQWDPFLCNLFNIPSSILPKSAFEASPFVIWSDQTTKMLLSLNVYKYLPTSEKCLLA